MSISRPIMFTIKYLRKYWFSDVSSFVMFNLHKISDSMMHNLLTLWKKTFFLCCTHQKYAIMDFCFLQAPQGRPSWGIPWFWSGMGRGRSMPNSVLYLKLASCSENFVVMLHTKVSIRKSPKKVVIICFHWWYW